MSEKTYNCRGKGGEPCGYEGPMPKRECPRCGAKLPGPPPGTKFRKTTKKGEPSERVALRMGETGAKTLDDLTKRSGLDTSKVVRLGVAVLDKIADGDGDAFVESLGLPDDVVEAALKQR